MRDYISSIEIRSEYGDKVFLRRGVNPHTGEHETCHKESWLMMLKGHIRDIEKEIRLIEEEEE